MLTNNVGFAIFCLGRWRPGGGLRCANPPYVFTCFAGFDGLAGFGGAWVDVQLAG